MPSGREGRLVLWCYRDFTNAVTLSVMDAELVEPSSLVSQLCESVIYVIVKFRISDYL